MDIAHISHGHHARTFPMDDGYHAHITYTTRTFHMDITHISHGHHTHHMGITHLSHGHHAHITWTSRTYHMDITHISRGLHSLTMSRSKCCIYSRACVFERSDKSVRKNLYLEQLVGEYDVSFRRDLMNLLMAFRSMDIPGRGSENTPCLRRCGINPRTTKLFRSTFATKEG